MPFLQKITCIALLLCSKMEAVQAGATSDTTPSLRDISTTLASFSFNRTIHNNYENGITARAIQSPNYTGSFDGNSLQITASENPALFLDDPRIKFNSQQSFSIQFWIKTTMDGKHIYPLVSQKEISNAGIPSQKKMGWMFYCSGGTWAWNIGTGKRRLTYERENGEKMPLNDGKWHQLGMSYNSHLSEIRLFYDGEVKALYNIGDSVGFHVAAEQPLAIGSAGINKNDQEIIEEITRGAKELQQLADAFHQLGAGMVRNEDFLHLMSDPQKLFSDYLHLNYRGQDTTGFSTKLKQADFTAINKLRSILLKNPYTIHQVIDFVEVAPVAQFYSLENGKIVTNETAAQSFSERRKFHAPTFDVDNLEIGADAWSDADILASYKKFFTPAIAPLKNKTTSFVAADWNIWHGGKHFTKEKHGFDSRMRIVEMLRQEKADVIMMQETYSSGEYIAAELGYYFATTADWDYLNQGSNVSILSRYPIKELYVPAGAPFMNVAVKISVSKTQDMYVMSNWYGMQKFPTVYDFHRNRFAETDSIPVLFGGDFNAAPDSDGGTENPASAILTAQHGFTDAYRSKFPDVKTHPGFSHIINQRIDQVYYKGTGIRNTYTKTIDQWPGGFPSDHYLQIAGFTLNYITR